MKYLKIFSCAFLFLLLTACNNYETHVLQIGVIGKIPDHVSKDIEFIQISVDNYPNILDSIVITEKSLSDETVSNLINGFKISNLKIPIFFTELDKSLNDIVGDYDDDGMQDVEAQYITFTDEMKPVIGKVLLSNEASLYRSLPQIIENLSKSDHKL